MSTTAKFYERRKVKKEGEKRNVASESTHVTLNVRGQDEEEVRVFKVRRKTKLLKLMQYYSDMRGVEWNAFRFLLDGSRNREYHTPDDLKLKDGDEIDAMLYQESGFSPSSSMIF
ncbi:PREDICTED: putative small ubiquitin-related modifier 6 [Camelina sativa]|uniref:Small ubiquitin-related modifier 6 n=1 Tax=Camelina sativa TaxID=90675 RepID=A0ABM0UT78_CAMSA|nr:PREDICTED: putative small ubiquitin-related modifier 6 [Camelina sativa]